MEDIPEQQEPEVPEGDLCAVMDEALYFLNSTTVIQESTQMINLDILQIMANIADKRVSNEGVVLRSIYRNYMKSKEYESRMEEKAQRLFDSQNSIPQELFYRFYSRVSEKLLLKVLFFNLNRRSIGFIGHSLLQVLQINDSHQASNNFDKFMRIISLVVLENRALIRMLLDLIVEEKMVSSEQEFIRVMEEPAPPQQNVSAINPTAIKKLGLTARKYKDSNQMNKLLNSFFEHIKNQVGIFQKEGGTLYKKFRCFRLSVKMAMKPSHLPYPHNHKQLNPIDTSVRESKTPIRNISSINRLPYSDQELDMLPIVEEETQEEKVKHVGTGLQPSKLPKSKFLLTKASNGLPRKPMQRQRMRRKFHDRKNTKNSVQMKQARKLRSAQQVPAKNEQTKSKSIRVKHRNTSIFGNMPNRSSLFSARNPAKSMTDGGSVSQSRDRLNNFSEMSGSTDGFNLRGKAGKSRYARNSKLHQYTYGFEDWMNIQNWNKFGLERKNSQIVKYPTAISKDLIVGMNYKRTNGGKSVQSLKNLVGQLVNLEYMQKLHRKEVNENSHFRIELKINSRKRTVEPELLDKAKVTVGSFPLGINTSSDSTGSTAPESLRGLSRGKQRLLSMLLVKRCL